MRNHFFTRAFLMLSLMASVRLHAQMTPGLKFNKLVHNFGNVKEEDGPISTIFSFRNISEHPVHIVKVETSCGCTTPEYTKDTIMPGDTGFVKAIYDTRGRHHDFHKNLFIHFNKENYYTSLMISGYVIPQANLLNRPKHFGTTYANLAFTTTMADFPKLLNTEKRSIQIKAFNYMGYPIHIYELTDVPDFIEVDLGDSTIDVKDSLTITITADGSKVGMFGEVRRRIGLVTDDPTYSTKFLHVYANVYEDFSGLSKKELKQAPVIVLDSAGTIDLGRHIAGEKFNHNVRITNKGKTPLTLRAVVPNCSCIKYRLPKETIEPGETIDMVLTIDTVNQTIARHTKYVTIMSNDPSRPEIRLRISMNITSH